MVSLPGLYVCWVMSFESAELDAVDWPEPQAAVNDRARMLAADAMVRTMCCLLNMGFLSSSVRHAHGSKPCLMHARQLYSYWVTTKQRYSRMLVISIAYGRLEPRNLARKRTISHIGAERNGVHCSSVKPSNTNPGLTTQETSASPWPGTVRCQTPAGTTACPDTVTSA